MKCKPGGGGEKGKATPDYQSYKKWLQLRGGMEKKKRGGPGEVRRGGAGKRGGRVYSRVARLGRSII